ncbi:MAG TPA: isocitrate dehydrogenase kinase/phosphatase AceK regulatory subunit, partial [Mycobacterium sp.]|nr:isocitrate dehydrogenase kinase/phosphatase AceK regulatory subunit [Mycobacterium sp.]
MDSAVMLATPATAADLILSAHRACFSQFNAFTAKARDTFDDRAWLQGYLNTEKRVGLYRAAVNETWRKLRREFAERLRDRAFWMAARHVVLQRIVGTYDADLALTFFYSTMRLAFDETDVPVEYADDGLARRSRGWSRHPVLQSYPAAPEQLRLAIECILQRCGFRSPFEDIRRDAALVTARLAAEWRRQAGDLPPRTVQMLEPVFFRDREAYLVGKLRSARAALPVVLALRHDGPGITVDAVLTGK